MCFVRCVWLCVCVPCVQARLVVVASPRLTCCHPHSCCALLHVVLPCGVAQQFAQRAYQRRLRGPFSKVVFSVPGAPVVVVQPDAAAAAAATPPTKSPALKTSASVSHKKRRAKGLPSTAGRRARSSSMDGKARRRKREDKRPAPTHHPAGPVVYVAMLTGKKVLAASRT